MEPMNKEQLLEWVESAFDSHIVQGDEVRVSCPYCPTPDEKKRLYINLELRVFYCFRCEHSGRVSLLMTTVPTKDRVEPHSLITEEEKRERGHRKSPDRGRKDWSHNPLGELALDYLNRRGVPKNLVKQLGLSYISDGYYKGRIRFPVHDLSRKEVYCFYRAFLPDITPKVMFPSTGDTPVRKSAGLFNACWLDTSKFVYITEGEFDALTLFPRGVALLGNTMSPEQEGIFTQKVGACVPVYVALDGDKRNNARKIARRLASNYDKVYLVKIGKEDPNELGREGLLDYIFNRSVHIN